MKMVIKDPQSITEVIADKARLASAMTRILLMTLARKGSEDIIEYHMHQFGPPSKVTGGIYVWDVGHPTGDYQLSVTEAGKVDLAISSWTATPNLAWEAVRKYKSAVLTQTQDRNLRCTRSTCLVST